MSLFESAKNYIKNASINRDAFLVIKRSKLFNKDFAYRGKYKRDKSIRKYLKSWQTGVMRKKPMPGFHPGIYSISHQINSWDPFAHYIKNDQPEGAWITPVITPNSVVDSFPSSTSVALHLHLYYPEMADDIFECLFESKQKPDLLISVRTQEASQYIQSRLEGVYEGKFFIKEFPNRGRDIGSLLTGFREEILKYNIIGHFHTKQSPHFSKREEVSARYRLLLENTLGGQFPMMDTIINKMSAHPRLGLVFADDPCIHSWGSNLAYAEELANRMGVPLPLPSEINFPSGTMFWARVKALDPLFSLELDWDDYPVEPLACDGSMLHAIERILPLVAESKGYSIAVTNIDC